jgi:hypothetical protein
MGLSGLILTKEQKKKKGEDGERALNEWLKEQGLSYLYVNQAENVQSTLFKGAVKRPDFLVLFESIGLIAVDVKNYEPFHQQYGLEYEKEVKRVLAFERLFRIPVWYAYLGKDESGPCWYWISALRAVEVGELKTRGKDNTQFLAIKIGDFCKVRTNADLGGLYTQRLPKVEKIAQENMVSIDAGAVI